MGLARDITPVPAIALGGTGDRRHPAGDGHRVRHAGGRRQARRRRTGSSRCSDVDGQGPLLGEAQDERGARPRGRISDHRHPQGRHHRRHRNRRRTSDDRRRARPARRRRTATRGSSATRHSSRPPSGWATRRRRRRCRTSTADRSRAARSRPRSGRSSCAPRSSGQPKKDFEKPDGLKQGKDLPRDRHGRDAVLPRTELGAAPGRHRAQDLHEAREPTKITVPEPRGDDQGGGAGAARAS